MKRAASDRVLSKAPVISESASAPLAQTSSLHGQVAAVGFISRMLKPSFVRAQLLPNLLKTISDGLKGGPLASRALVYRTYELVGEAVSLGAGPNSRHFIPFQIGGLASADARYADSALRLGGYR